MPSAAHAQGEIKNTGPPETRTKEGPEPRETRGECATSLYGAKNTDPSKTTLPNEIVVPPRNEVPKGDPMEETPAKVSPENHEADEEIVMKDALDATV